MRIIGGEIKGRRIRSPRGNSESLLIRPTSARAREALFNIIESKVRGTRVLDLYAGTGALGLEALSRQAQSAVFVDKNVNAVSLIKKNIDLCGFSNRSLVIRRDLTKGLFFLKKAMPLEGVNLVFVDPPYGERLGRTTIIELDETDLVSVDGLVIVESSLAERLPELIGKLRLFDQRQYGEAGFWLYHRQEA